MNVVQPKRSLSETVLHNQTWRVKSLLICHGLALFLVASLLLPLTSSLWEWSDRHFFTWVNASLDQHPHWQVFWACANHKWADWIEDLVILLFFAVCVKHTRQGLKKKKVAEILFFTLYGACIIYVINQLLFRENFPIARASPSLVIEGAIRLSQEITWMAIKDKSLNSFPGDHATTALLFASSLSYLGGWRKAIWGWCYAAFLCMPRLITGAHWLSDILVGSGAILLITLSWALCTPLFVRGTALILRIMPSRHSLSDLEHGQ